LAAEGINGDPILTETEVSGRVTGVMTYNGEYYLRLSDGRMVEFKQIYEVVDPGTLADAEGDGASDAE